VALLSGQARRADFDEYRYNRIFHGWKEAMWAAGLKLLTQVAEGKAVCFLTSDCVPRLGAVFLPGRCCSRS
jgi:hypothetical protein